jgi:hypothetical protein
MGRVAKGAKCNVTGCSNIAVRSISTEKVIAAGLKVGEIRRVYLCKEHYKEFKRQTKQQRTMEKWRHGAIG